LKYPTISNSSDVAVVTKVDLADAVEFDWSAAHANIQPSAQVCEYCKCRQKPARAWMRGSLPCPTVDGSLLLY